MKIFVLFLGYCIVFLALIVSGLWSERQVRVSAEERVQSIIRQEIEQKLKLATDAMANSLGLLVEGQPEEAQIAIIAKAISQFRFEDDKSGYFFVYKDHVPIAHPVRHDLIGKSLADAKDKHGVFYVRELKETGLNQSKEGKFVYYTFSKPLPDGTMVDAEKVAYGQKIANTDNFWIATGAYIDNVESEVRMHSGAFVSVISKNFLAADLAVCAIFVILIIPMIWSFYSNITKNVRILQTNITSFFEYLSYKTKDIALKPIDSKDEFGQMNLIVNENVKKNSARHRNGQAHDFAVSRHRQSL